MKRLRRALLFLCPLLAVNLFIIDRHVRSAGDESQEKDSTYDKVVQPFFANHCYACHNDERHTAGVNLEAFDSAASITKDRATLKVIYTKLKSGQMPPPERPRPNPEAMAAVVDWLGTQLGSIPDKTPTTEASEPGAGRVTIRRLNRIEYDNTVRDLLGVDLRLSENFPQDDSGYGFDNIADVLSLSPVLMEKYLAAAEKISRTAIFGPEALKPTLVRLRSGERNTAPQLTPLTDYDLSGLSLPNAIHTTHRFTVDGDYVIRATLGGERPAGAEALKLALWIDGKLANEVQVDPASLASFAAPGEPQQLWGIKHEFKIHLSAGDHWLAVAIPHLYEGLPASYNGQNPSMRTVPPRRPFKPPPDLTPKEIEELRKQVEKKAAEKVPANGARVSSLELGGPYSVAPGPTVDSQKRSIPAGI